jgi:hypothetical protein
MYGMCVNTVGDFQSCRVRSGETRGEVKRSARDLRFDTRWQILPILRKIRVFAVHETRVNHVDDPTIFVLQVPFVIQGPAESEETPPMTKPSQHPLADAKELEKSFTNLFPARVATVAGFYARQPVDPYPAEVAGGHAVMLDRPDVVIHGIDQIGASDVGEVGRPHYHSDSLRFGLGGRPYVAALS